MQEGKSYEHQAVLADELLRSLVVTSSGFYLDATYGRGGHSRSILQRLGAQGRLFAFDKDPEACVHARQCFVDDHRFTIHCGSYTDMEKLLREDLVESFSGILFDLGVSSPQLEDASRGFSFQKDGPLDMRMNPQEGISAATWLASARHDEIADVLRKYGEERNAAKIATAIKRVSYSLQTTHQLANLVASISDVRSSRHPATRTFLAIRMYLNHELEDLSAALGSALRLLKVGGRLAVISFHSLEDRIVKRFIQNSGWLHRPIRRLPVIDDTSRIVLKKIGSLIRPSADEIAINHRARSARLRVAEKTESVEAMLVT